MNNQEALSEEEYNLLKQGVRNWIEQDLKWKREEIVSIHIEYEIIEIDANKEQWKQWRHGRNRDVTVKRNTQEKQYQRFINLDDNEWQKKIDKA